MDPAKRLQEPELKLWPAHQGPGQQGKVLWASSMPYLRISRISSKLPFISPTLFWTQQFAISQLCPKTGRDPISNLNYPLVAQQDHLELATHRAPRPRSGWSVLQQGQGWRGRTRHYSQPLIEDAAG